MEAKASPSAVAQESECLRGRSPRRVDRGVRGLEYLKATAGATAWRSRGLASYSRALGCTVIEDEERVTRRRAERGRASVGAAAARERAVGAAVRGQARQRARSRPGRRVPQGKHCWMSGPIARALIQRQAIGEDASQSEKRPTAEVQGWAAPSKQAPKSPAAPRSAYPATRERAPSLRSFEHGLERVSKFACARVPSIGLGDNARKMTWSSSAGRPSARARTLMGSGLARRFISTSATGEWATRGDGRCKAHKERTRAHRDLHGHRPPRCEPARVPCIRAFLRWRTRRSSPSALGAGVGQAEVENLDPLARRFFA